MFGTHATVPVGGLSFDVWTSGPVGGEAIVLLHGFPQSAAGWDLIAPALADEGLRVIVPNQRGYSAAARPLGVEAYVTDALVGDVIGLLDSLGIGAAHIVGHDWGAAVAWPLAAHQPDRVLSLTAASVPHLAAYGRALREDADQQQRASYIGLLRQAGKAEDLLLADDAARLRAMYGDAVPADQVEAHLAVLSPPGALTAALNWYRAMTADLGKLGPVDVPTTYVWSDQDIAIGRVGAEECGSFVTGDYRFVELSGISHWIPEQAPEALIDAIIDRVGSVSRD